MKKSELKSLIKEIIAEVQTAWDADGYEIVVDGKPYFVNANFIWEEDSVDYRFDPNRGVGGQGQDLIAEVPQTVDEL